MKAALIVPVVLLSALRCVCCLAEPDEEWTRIQVADGRHVEVKSIQRQAYEWFETRDGYSVVRTPDRYEYAFQAEDGGLEPSGLLASTGKKLPFPPKIRPTAEYRARVSRGRPRGGAPPSPHPVQLRQPDGREIKVFLKGGPSLSWYEDERGYSILSVKGRLEFAVRGPDGALIGCGIGIGEMAPSEAGLKQRIEPSAGYLSTLRTEPNR